MTEDFEQIAPAEQPDVADQQPEPTQEAPNTAPEPAKRVSIDEALEKAFRDPEPAKETQETKDEAVSEDEGAPKRGPDGKFVAKEAAEKSQDDAAKDDTAKGDKPADEPEPSDAPARFSPDAKAAWKDAPAPVKAEVSRAIREMENGLAQKDAELKPLQEFIELAKSTGTTAADAAKNYIGMENLLRSDPVQGLRRIAQHMGLAPQQAAALMAGQAPGQPDPRDQQIAQLSDRLEQMGQMLGQHGQTLEQQNLASVSAQVEEFAKNHPRLDELSDEITRALNTGYAETLEDAYQIAEARNPRPQPAPKPDPTPVAQTQPVKSVTGAPSAGSNPDSRRRSRSIDEALERAFKF